MKTVAMFIAIAVMAFTLHAGKTITVPKDAKTIEAGLELAQEGDTVFVLNGVYKEKIMLKDKVALVGESVTKTVIRGKGRGVLVRGADGAVLRNFTIENGSKGILCENVTMTIEHNCVCCNKSSGIHCLVTLPMIRSNVVFRNRETGIFCETVRSLNTLIEHNVVGENGYCGIMLAGNSEVLVQNNVFSRNKQFGIWVNEGARRSRIVHNDFYMNRNNYNNYAQVDRSNLGIDPGYPEGMFGFKGVSPAGLFTIAAKALKGKGKNKKDIGLISEEEVQERWLDADNDGIKDEQDKCASIAEDKDGFADEDGCPDFDNDNDGIYDAQDQCPNEPEDRDAFADEDGCPEYDNDKDGVVDTVDACPGAPETLNGYRDDDGCPDRVPPGWKPEAASAAGDSLAATGGSAVDSSKKADPASGAADSTKKKMQRAKGNHQGGTGQL